jgi:hypothetical protein
MPTLRQIKAMARRTRNHPLYDPGRADKYNESSVEDRAVANMDLYETGVPSPVGRVPKGSTVIFSLPDGTPATWINGNVYIRRKGS